MNNPVKATEGKVGEERIFTFSKAIYEIREVLENPNISMWWTWTTGVCPHCKKQIERRINHDFYYIEILVEKDVQNKDVARTDVAMLGHTLDKRGMRISIDKYDEIFNKSKNFKHLVEVQ